MTENFTLWFSEKPNQYLTKQVLMAGSDSFEFKATGRLVHQKKEKKVAEGNQLKRSEFFLQPSQYIKLGKSPEVKEMSSTNRDFLYHHIFFCGCW